MNVNRYLSYKSTANWFAQNARTTTVAIANYSQRQRHDGALTDVFSIFFKSKWKTTSKDRCPARVKTLQEQISRPIDADTHCFRHASLLKSSFNSNRFYLYKTANSSGMTNKNTTEEMQIWRERLKIVFFSPKMCRTPQSIDFFVTDAKCARRQKTFSFPPEHTDISKPGMSNEKNYDNKNSLKYINMKWKPTLSFYTTNLSKLDQWDKPGSHWRHVYEWMWTGIYHTKVRPTDLRKMRALPQLR